MNKGFAFIRVSLVIGVLFSLSLAHKVNIYGYVDGGYLLLQAYFQDGKPVVDGQVKVFDDNDRLLAEGKTDEQGEYQWKVLKCSALKVVLNASAGHYSEYRLSKEEVCPDEAPKLTEPQKTIPADSVPQVQESPKQVTSGSPSLKPLMEQLKRIEKRLDRAQFRDVLGGIGYILGLIGLWALLKARKGHD